MKKIKQLWEKFWLNPWFGGMVIFGLAGMTSYFQINSYWADKHHFNGVFGWLGIGIVLTISAIYCAYKTDSTSTGIGG